MKRLKIFALYAAVPSFAFAHGQQVILLPIGQAAALAVILTFGCLLSFKTWGRLLFFLLPMVVIVGTWLIPGGLGLGVDATPYFLVGTIPPVFVAGASYAWFRKRTSPENIEANRTATKRGGGIALIALGILVIWYCLIIPLFTVDFGPRSNLAYEIVSLGQLVASIYILAPCFGRPWTMALIKATALSIGLTVAQMFIMGCVLTATSKY